MEEAERKGIVVYLGHDPELFHDSVRDNVLFGDEKDLKTYLKAVCIDREVSDMEEGEDTLIGNGGVRLSGGQAQRVHWQEHCAIKAVTGALMIRFLHWINRRRRSVCQCTGDDP